MPVEYSCTGCVLLNNGGWRELTKHCSVYPTRSPREWFDRLEEAHLILTVCANCMLEQDTFVSIHRSCSLGSQSLKITLWKRNFMPSTEPGTYKTHRTSCWSDKNQLIHLFSKKTLSSYHVPGAMHHLETTMNIKQDHWLYVSVWRLFLVDLLPQPSSSFLSSLTTPPPGCTS